MIEDRYQKVTQGIQDGSVAICDIINMIKKMIIAIFVEHTYGHERIKQNETFRTYPGKYSLKEYGTKAKELRQLSRSNKDHT